MSTSNSSKCASKDEVIQLHLLFAEIQRFIEEESNSSIDEINDQKLNENNASVTELNKSVEEHKDAVFALLSGLTSSIEGNANEDMYMDSGENDDRKNMSLTHWAAGSNNG